MAKPTGSSGPQAHDNPESGVSRISNSVPAVSGSVGQGDTQTKGDGKEGGADSSSTTPAIKPASVEEKVRQADSKSEGQAESKYEPKSATVLQASAPKRGKHYKSNQRKKRKAKEQRRTFESWLAKRKSGAGLPPGKVEDQHAKKETKTEEKDKEQKQKG